MNTDAARRFGAQSLDAGESVSYSPGLIYRKGSFEATIDACRIEIDDRIVLSENLNTTLPDPLITTILAPLGIASARFGFTW